MWFSKNKRVGNKSINIACRVEIVSGYAQGQKVTITGELIRIEVSLLCIKMSRVHANGLSVFDTQNTLRLIFGCEPRILTVSVHADSYKREDFGNYLVRLKFQPGTSQHDLEMLIEAIEKET